MYGRLKWQQKLKCCLIRFCSHCSVFAFSVDYGMLQRWSLFFRHTVDDLTVAVRAPMCLRNGYQERCFMSEDCDLLAGVDAQVDADLAVTQLDENVCS